MNPKLNLALITSDSFGGESQRASFPQFPLYRFPRLKGRPGFESLILGKPEMITRTRSDCAPVGD